MAEAMYGKGRGPASVRLLGGSAEAVPDEVSTSPRVVASVKDAMTLSINCRKQLKQGGSLSVLKRPPLFNQGRLKPRSPTENKPSLAAV